MSNPNPPPALWMARAWLALVVLSLRRQANARQMVWIALGLLAIATAITAVQTARGEWGMAHWRWPRPRPVQQKNVKGSLQLNRLPNDQQTTPPVSLDQTQAALLALPADPAGQGPRLAVAGAARAIPAGRET